jgi:hypothetical protein
VSNDPVWLPARLRPTDYDGWDAYIDHAYGIFVRDFFKSRVMFRGRRVLVDDRVGDDGRIDYFWHLVSRDPDDRKRSRDENFHGARCECIAWIRAVIESAGDPSRVCCWPEGEGAYKAKWRIALPDFSYLVSLGDRGSKYFILTAFPPDTWTRYPDKMRAKYEAYQARKS